jgi:hypothetical protein
MMTREQIKRAIRNVDPVLFESVYAEVLREDYPNWRVTNLVESRQSGNDFSRDVYQRVV